MPLKNKQFLHYTVLGLILALGTLATSIQCIDCIAERKLTKGVFLLKQNKLIDALDQLENIYSVNPTQKARKYFFLGQTFAELGKHHKAMFYLEKCADKLKSDKMYFQLGEIATELFQVEKAVQNYEKSYFYNPRFTLAKMKLSKIFVEKARKYLGKNFTQLAYENVKKAFNYDPYNANSYIVAGQIETENNRLEQARKWFKQGLLFHPGNYQLNYLLLVTEMKLKSFQEAMDIIKFLYFLPDPKLHQDIIGNLFAISYELPGEPAWKILLADYLIDNGKKMEACNLLNKTEPRNPNVFKYLLDMKCKPGSTSKKNDCLNLSGYARTNKLYKNIIKLLEIYCKNQNLQLQETGYPSVNLYYPILYGTKFHKVFLVGYTILQMPGINPDLLKFSLQLVSTDECVQVPTVRFRIDNPEKTMFLDPLCPVPVPLHSWKPFQVSNLVYTIRIPSQFLESGFRVSVSFASEQMKMVGDKRFDHVGFVPVFRTVTSTSEYVIKPATMENGI